MQGIIYLDDLTFDKVRPRRRGAPAREQQAAGLAAAAVRRPRPQPRGAARPRYSPNKHRTRG